MATALVHRSPLIMARRRKGGDPAPSKKEAAEIDNVQNVQHHTVVMKPTSSNTTSPTNSKAGVTLRKKRTLLPSHEEASIPSKIPKLKLEKDKHEQLSKCTCKFVILLGNFYVADVNKLASFPGPTKERKGPGTLCSCMCRVAQKKCGPPVITKYTLHISYTLSVDLPFIIVALTKRLISN